jgi:hypothetical protein
MTVGIGVLLFATALAGWFLTAVLADNAKSFQQLDILMLVQVIMFFCALAALFFLVGELA